MNKKEENVTATATTAARSFQGFSTHELSAELNALGLDDEDEDAAEPFSISDLLNSRGDLTGLSGWTESDADGYSEGLEDDAGNLSDASSASTESISISMSNLQQPPTSAADSGSPDPSKGRPEESVSVKPKYSVPNYGCRVFSGFGMDILQSSKTSGWRCLPGEQDEQIFIRAPNFRTPGGYKPPLVEKEPRNMTDQEIFEEVREMYAQDGRKTDAEKDSFQLLIQKSPEVENTGARDLATLGDSEVVEEPKATKKVSWVCGDSKQDPAQLYSESYNGDISRCLPRQRSSTGTRSSARKENLEELSRIWDEITRTKQLLEQDMNSLVTPAGPSPSFSVDEAQVHPTENSKEVVAKSSPSSKQHSLIDLASPSPKSQKVVSFGKRPLISSAVPPSFNHDSKPTEPAGVTKPPPKSRMKRSVNRRTREKQRIREAQNVSSAAGAASSSQLSFLEAGLGFDQGLGEIDQILQETDMQESDFDEILSQISCDRGGERDLSRGYSVVPPDLFNDPETPHELNSALQQLQISDWAKEGAQECMQKYYEERYRRDHCEALIANLRKQELELGEKLAVAEGLLRGKEERIVKFSKLWKGLLAQWKAHEKECKAQTNQLQSENEQLKGVLKESKDRIAAYEAELEKAIQLSGDFKRKIEAAVEELQQERHQSLKQKEDFKAKLDSLEILLSETKSEKEAGIRALRDCQESLDTTLKSLSTTSEELRVVKAAQVAQENELKKLQTENGQLKSDVAEVREAKSSLSTQYKVLEAEIDKLKADKVLLGSAHEAELRKKLKEEREKLHDYYNAKIKEILQTESTKMIEAEREFIGLHEKKLENVELEAEKRLDEMRNKFTAQVQQMKQKYEGEVKALKKENEEQGKVIGAVSRQLQSYNGGRGDEASKQSNGNEREIPNGQINISQLVEAMTGQRKKLCSPHPTSDKQ